MVFCPSRQSAPLFHAWRSIQERKHFWIRIHLRTLPSGVPPGGLSRYNITGMIGAENRLFELWRRDLPMQRFVRQNRIRNCFADYAIVVIATASQN